MNKLYAVRDEAFGFTFFDKSKLRHHFLAQDELDTFLNSQGIKQEEIEFLKAKRNDFRKDILYSPIRIYYEVTLACNLHCRYCYNDSGKRRDVELTTNEILKSLDNFKANNVLDIRFTGGELTSRPDWYQILKYAKDLGFAVSCNTNAAYYTPEKNKLFADLDLEQVTVSLDGGEKNHEMNRGKGTFARTIENMRQMHELGVRLRINTLVNRFSVNDVEEVLNIASKYTDEINFFTVEFIGRGRNLESTDGVSIEDHYKMSQRINSLKTKYPGLNILHFAEVSKTTSVNTDIGEKFGLKIGPPSGSTTLNVLSNGEFCRGGYTPYIEPSLAFGNVKKDDLFDIWQSDNTLEKMRDDGGRLIQFCKKCPKFIDNICQGPKYETELNRLINPEVKNPTCIHGEEKSLLLLSKE